jgi:hypothetical protein
MYDSNIYSFLHHCELSEASILFPYTAISFYIYNDIIYSYFIFCKFIEIKKSEAVPLHATEAHGGEEV